MFDRRTASLVWSLLGFADSNSVAGIYVICLKIGSLLRLIGWLQLIVSLASASTCACSPWQPWQLFHLRYLGYRLCMGIAQQLDPSAQQRLAQTVLERTLRPTGRNKDVRRYRLGIGGIMGIIILWNCRMIGGSIMYHHLSHLMAVLYTDVYLTPQNYFIF